jgi:hypothetical protein
MDQGHRYEGQRSPYEEIEHQPWPAFSVGRIELVMSDDYTDLPTARTTLLTGYVRLLLACRSCLRSRDADLQGLIDAGRGDVPLVNLKFRWQLLRPPGDRRRDRPQGQR